MPNILDKKMTNQTFTNQNQAQTLGADTNQTLDNSLESNQNHNENKGGLVNILSSFVPFVPALFEQWTGQKLPMMTGTLGEMQTTLSQLTIGLQTVINHQQQIWQEIMALKNNANIQLLVLTIEKKQSNYSKKSLT